MLGITMIDINNMRDFPWPIISINLYTTIATPDWWYIVISFSVFSKKLSCHHPRKDELQPNKKINI